MKLEFSYDKNKRNVKRNVTIQEVIYELRQQRIKVSMMVKTCRNYEWTRIFFLEMRTIRDLSVVWSLG